MESCYITTPIYYVNDSPHIGHAYTTIACDVMSRFQRINGKEVYFLTGTDEHGQKIDKSAKNKKIDCKSFTDVISKRFQRLVNSCGHLDVDYNLLNISNDDFIRTTEERHKKTAEEIWNKIKGNGHIYLDKYSGWYSVRDEAYYSESELVLGEKGEKLAPTGSVVEWIEEDSYFFDLSKWQQKLLDFYESNPEFIYPKSRYNEVVSFVKGGKEFKEGALKDLSVSRTTFDWGVKVPGDDKHVMYVWLDALTNYLTSLDFCSEKQDLYKKFWCDSVNSPVHVVGKDILRFHAVYWPAFLMAANLPLPKKIVAHGWWTIEGKKMSKSIGNVVSPDDLVGEFGLDQTRFFLMREIPFGSDGNFSKELMSNRLNSDLANNIGNLVQRSLSMVNKNCDGVVPFPSCLKEEDESLISCAVFDTLNKYKDNFSNFRFDLALSDIIRLSSLANEYIDKNKPWVLKKGDTERMKSVLYTLVEICRVIGILLQPFTPDSAKKILLQTGYSEGESCSYIPLSDISADKKVKSGKILPKPKGVFPRV